MQHREILNVSIIELWTHYGWVYVQASGHLGLRRELTGREGRLAKMVDPSDDIHLRKPHPSS